MCGLIDLNTANTEDETPVCVELWHACAGPLISLPKKGSVVVYFPQGHFEHLVEHPAVAYDLPPHVFCHVDDVKLQADANSDEVYALVSLAPDKQIQQIKSNWSDRILETGAEEDLVKSMTPHMFCKTLTASDTSTHGGFSVPRRAAEDCFPPLDYAQQRPSQELVAKDLHGIEWKFRHIYRGQPRRHLLTSGWSAFVNKKKLMSGDAVLFLRGGDGVLRLGVRRAAQDKYSQPFNAGRINAVVNGSSLQRTFDIFYYPRARSSGIIVPYSKFCKGLAHSFSSGMRCKIRFETEDPSQRRRSGLIISVSDTDPLRWPGSKWKSLLVRWDDTEGNHLNRVSPWDIEPSSSMSGPNGFESPGIKRSRNNFPTTETDFPVHKDADAISDFGEPKVLQGQEVFGFRPPFAAVEAHLPRVDALKTSIRSLHTDSEKSWQGNPSNETLQFQKVLKGQETSNILNGVRVSDLGNSWSNTPLLPSLAPKSSPSFFLMLQQPNAPPSEFMSLFHSQPKKFVNSFGGYQRTPTKLPSFVSASHQHNQPNLTPLPFQSQPFFRDNQKFISMCKESCRLFGFPLTEAKAVEAASKVDKATGLPCNDPS